MAKAVQNRDFSVKFLQQSKTIQGVLIHMMVEYEMRSRARRQVAVESRRSHQQTFRSQLSNPLMPFSLQYRAQSPLNEWHSWRRAYALEKKREGSIKTKRLVLAQPVHVLVVYDALPRPSLPTTPTPNVHRRISPQVDSPSNSNSVYSLPCPSLLLVKANPGARNIALLLHNRLSCRRGKMDMDENLEENKKKSEKRQVTSTTIWTLSDLRRMG